MVKPAAAYTGDEPHVFVCYAHDDSDIVYPEIVWLQSQGVRVWYDEGISPGAEFPEELGQAILRASVVLFYLSSRSIASRHCRDEVYFALDNSKPLLALHLEATALPAGLALTTSTTQALLRYQLNQQGYRSKLLEGIATFGSTTTRTRVDSDHLQQSALRKSIRSVAAIATIFALIASGYGGIRYFGHQADIRWVKDEAIPRIRQLAESQWRDYTEPFELAQAALDILPDDPELAELVQKISLIIDITSEPSGAEVALKPYADPDAGWQLLGTTPISDLRLPVGVFRWRVEKAGFETVTAAHSTWDLRLSDAQLIIPNDFHRTLDPIGTRPADMVRIPGVDTAAGPIADFFIDRYEVTNQDFKTFVDAGGYTRPEFWHHDFVEDGQSLSFEAAMARFVDQSRRPGPSTWLGGTYPAGEADHPVSGVSWYEAAAYAEFIDRVLPSGTHWGLARGEQTSLIQYPQLGGMELFAPFSNFNRTGTVPVGSLRGFTTYGAYDLAGNVREWCFNRTAAGRLVRGGSYDDNSYRFAELSQAPPMQRDAGYGFRTMSRSDQRTIAAVFDDVPILPARTYRREDVVSDDVFEVFRRQFDYDPTDLNARLLSRDDSAPEWIFERHSIETAYSDERMIINLFLPRNAQPPYQSVVYFPGSAATFQTSSADLVDYYEFPLFLSFLVRSGRAVALPVYQGTFERGDPKLIPLHLGNQTHTYTEYLVQVVQDTRRAIDYLDSRPDIDRNELAFYGMSWGGNIGGIISSVEPRIKATVLLAGGILDTGRPEASVMHYAPRVTVPVLMLAGRYDSMLGFESATRPLFELLGTPSELKTLLVYETDHIPPREEFVTEILAWLDQQFGPVERL